MLGAKASTSFHPMDNPYYLLIKDETQGPFTLHQVRAMWNAGTLTGVTFFTRPGMTEWKPLLDMQNELESQASPTSPSQPAVHGNPPSASQSSTAQSPNGVKSAQAGQPAVSGQTPTTNEWVMALLGTVFAAVLFLTLIALSRPAPSGRDSNSTRSAYEAACSIIWQEYPGAKGVSSIENTPVHRIGAAYHFEIMVDGLNAFGGPVRNLVLVEVEYQDGRWISKGTYNKK